MLKLHGFAVSNYSNMVRQSLLEKGVEFEQLPTRPGQEDDFLAISPLGKIPCLETADGFLIETSVILDYIEEAHPEPPLYPATAFERAKAREIMRVTEQYIELTARRHLGAAFFGKERSEDAFKEVRPQVEQGIRAFNQLANFGPYVMGSEFGNADIVVYYCFGLANQVLKRIYDWDVAADVPGLAEFFAAMEERDVTRRVVAEHKEAMTELMAKLAAAK